MDMYNPLHPAAPYNMAPQSHRRQFDEYFRCYPVVMLAGSDREHLNYGGKIIMPPSALEKLIRLHITYPMLFELLNGVEGKKTHAGVLEFIAEEGRAYLPYWIMQSLHLEPGDMLQIKSTDLPPGSLIKLQPQSTSFLDITDPKAVLERAMRAFSCLTVGDVFSFSYADSIYSIAVLETKPANAISVLEVDLEVDFAAPLGYVEPERPAASGTSTPRSGAGPLKNEHGVIRSAGSMAAAINYAAIAPGGDAALKGEKALSSHFATHGQRLAPPRRSAGAAGNVPSPRPAASPAPSIKAEDGSTATNAAPRKTNGPQPLRLPPGKLFFGYPHVPVKKADGEGGSERKTEEVKFPGIGLNLRGKPVARDAGSGGEGKRKAEKTEEEPKKAGGRTLRDSKR